mmetsp:Transcript_142110/g.250618  ORF Transcript_142110/g.250618 Transcript_142110/m.250618 type:complete len:512 (-) Transcript_142110:175-1710(-)
MPCAAQSFMHLVICLLALTCSLARFPRLHDRALQKAGQAPAGRSQRSASQARFATMRRERLSRNAAPKPPAPHATAVLGIPGLHLQISQTALPAVTTSGAPQTSTAAAPAPAADNAMTGSNSTAPAPAPGEDDSPPFIHGPLKILVYGLVFALIYIVVWLACLPAERRPAAVDEGFMRWMEDQETESTDGGVNCALIRVKQCNGLSDQYRPCCVNVEVQAFNKSVDCGETSYDQETNWQTCFVAPLLDQEKGRPVTMGEAKPQVRFVLKYHKPGESNATEFAEAILKPGQNASSSSSAAASGPTGLTQGQWCVTNAKLAACGSGVLGMAKKVASGNMGTVSVEAKLLTVNAAGKAFLKTTYYTAAVRGEFKKPYSFAGRILATALFGMLLLNSLPFVGDMFNGCFYLSCHGLSASSTLFCMAIPHWLQLFNVPVPGWVSKLSLDDLKAAGIALGSLGWSGLSLCFWWGWNTPCTNHFFMLEVLMVVDSSIFAMAYQKGEGGGLMGLLRGGS